MFHKSRDQFDVIISELDARVILSAVSKLGLPVWYLIGYDDMTTIDYLVKTLGFVLVGVVAVVVIGAALAVAIAVVIVEAKNPKSGIPSHWPTFATPIL